jgi:Holliday junction resolvase
MKAARRDINQPEIIKAFERLGYQVINIAKAGHVVPGLPDLLVAKNGKVALVEVKSASGKLTDKEQAFHRKYAWQTGGQFPIFTIRTEDDVARVSPILTRKGAAKW